MEAKLHKPAFRIVANGDDITASIRKRFISLSITDEAGMQSDSLSLVLDDSPPHIRLPSQGAELRVWLGYEPSVRFMGLYVVDEIGLILSPARMTIKAAGAPFEKSTAYRELQTQQTRSWTPRTVRELVEAIASEHGLTPAVGPEIGQITLPHVDQINESNMHLLTRLAMDLDAVAKANGGSLIFVKKGLGQTASGKELERITLTSEDVTSCSVTISGRQNYNTVVATWRDVDAAKDVEECAGEGEPMFRLRHVFPTKAAAQQAARAKLGAFQRGKANISLSLPGRPGIMAESRLVLGGGFREGIAGELSVTRVVHNLGSGGLTVSVDGEVI
ncbi:contractile injection system protein, VgrG/Pvc8 family [Desulfovibrio ferrophilus]|uniref:Late control D family protein n=1 Tax=Desulfovibrio ferrophilus TaxID=241368 RepID=A0A2Z6AZ21_9BACT|nr:contractile injection system protein, VgrG/Pvc8 family [Desulfovibrio ferrophilus]BBD08440.1 late control D family protein [Desulfovibrio ferrophilus]